MEKDWEKEHYQQDVNKVKKINKLNSKSNAFLIFGLGSFILALSALGDMFKVIYEAAKEMMEASHKINFAQLFSGISTTAFVAIIILALVGLFCIFKAMFIWEEADNLSASRFFWIPDEDEVKYIEKRFENELTQRILSAVSPTDTESIEVAYKGVKIKSYGGSEVFNFIQYGYSRLTNYGSKQMAYYLASHSFPEGFVIYQTKIAPVGANRYIGGVTDIGGEVPPEPEPEKRLNAMFTWLATQIQKIMKSMKLKVSFKIPKPKDGPSPTDSGQIVINKGYNPSGEDKLPL